MKNNDLLIAVEKVKEIFGVSINQVRNYKSLGIIEPFSKNGAKFMYSEEEVKTAKKILDEKKVMMTLKQIGVLIQEHIKKRRKKIKSNY